jgi:hypothetical protein
MLWRRSSDGVVTAFGYKGGDGLRLERSDDLTSKDFIPLQVHQDLREAPALRPLVELADNFRADVVGGGQDSVAQLERSSRPHGFRACRCNRGLRPCRAVRGRPSIAGHPRTPRGSGILSLSWGLGVQSVSPGHPRVRRISRAGSVASWSGLLTATRVVQENQPNCEQRLPAI